MTWGPYFPIDVSQDDRQVDGDQKMDPVTGLSETHRRNAATAPKPSAEAGRIKSKQARGAWRYREDEL